LRNEVKTMTVKDVSKIECKFFHGSMYGVNYMYEVSPEEMIWANFFKESGSFAPDHLEVNNAPLRESQWEIIASALEPLIPELVEYVPKVKDPSEPEVEMLDGPNEYIFKITWKTDDGEKEVEYCIPPHELYDPLVSAIRKTAESLI